MEKLRNPKYTEVDYCWKWYSVWYRAFLTADVLFLGIYLTSLGFGAAALLFGQDTAKTAALLLLISMVFAGLAVVFHHQLRFWRAMWKIAMDLEFMRTRYREWLAKPSADYWD